MTETPLPPAGPLTPGFPPTIEQGPAFTTAPPTVQQLPGAPAGAFPPTVQQDVPLPPGQAAGTGLPAEVAVRYRPERLIGSGTEGSVWLARRESDGRQFAVKVHRPAPPDHVEAYLTILERLRDPSLRFLPAIEEYGVTPGTAGGQLWVVMEYLPLGTLADLMARERVRGGGLPEPRAKQVVLCIAEAIRYWLGTIHVNLLDLKPANFMVRRSDPLELVVVDFGGAVRMTLSQQFGNAVTTLAYMPPEGLARWRSEHWPWWALGEITYELITGHTRFNLGDISSGVSDRLTLQDRAVGRPDLAAIPDPRWRLLAAGLLTRSPTHRWTYEQVRDWAASGSPAVYEDQAEGLTGPAKAPITYRHRGYHDPAGLAAAMADDPAQAATWLQGEGRESLLRWLDAQPRDTAYSRDYLYGLGGAGSDRRAHRAVTAFLATFQPDHAPSYQGHPVDADGLLELARLGSQGDQLLAAILDDGILEIAAGCDCGHTGCRSQCAVLEQVATEVPAITSAAEARVREVGEQVANAGDGAAWRPLTGADRAAMTSRAAVLTIAPDSRRGLLAPLSAIGVRNLGWWTEAKRAAQRADARTVSGRVAAVTALLLATRAPAVYAAQEARLLRERRARAAPRRRADRRLIIAAVALAVTAAGPIGLGISVWRDHLMSLAATPPPDLRAVPGGAQMMNYLPAYVFGVLVLAGLLGLALLRPPWDAGRVPSVVAGAALIALGAASPILANATAGSLARAGRHAYQLGPVPISVLGQTCGEYWTSNAPVNGSYRRWALVGPTGSGGCSGIVAYHGWREAWSASAPGGSYYVALGSYGHDVMAAVRQGGNDRVVLLNDRNGKVLRRWRCPGNQAIDGWVFHGISDHSRFSHDRASIEVSCQTASGSDRSHSFVPRR